MKDARNCQHDSVEFVGSAVVVGATFDRGSTILELRTFTEDCIDYAINGIPDPEGFAALIANTGRPISVKLHGRSRRCSVVTLGPGGARHTDIGVGKALALLQSGVLAVVDGGLQTRSPCSTVVTTQSTP